MLTWYPAPHVTPAAGNNLRPVFTEALSAASTIPLTFPDKRAALLGAFVNRFSIGFVIGAVALPWPWWASGLLIGVLLSLADAIITEAYAPILILGAIGGAFIAWIVQRFGM